MAVHMTRSNEIQGSAAGRLLEMLLPRPTSTFLLRCADGPDSILVVDRSLPASEGCLAVVATETGKIACKRLERGFSPSSVWGRVTWVLKDPDRE